MKLPVHATDPEDGDDVLIEDADGNILGVDEIVAALNTPPPYVHGEAVPVADILAEIEHIRENGLSLAKFGGENVDEGRCRELCALYLREFIVSKRWGDELRKLDAAPTISNSLSKEG